MRYTIMSNGIFDSEGKNGGHYVAWQGMSGGWYFSQDFEKWLLEKINSGLPHDAENEAPPTATGEAPEIS